MKAKYVLAVALVVGTMLVLGAQRAGSLHPRRVGPQPHGLLGIGDASSADGMPCVSTVNNATYQGTYNTGTQVGSGVTLAALRVCGIG